MTSKFCQICNNRLTCSYTNEELNFRCNVCKNPYPPNPRDTLRYSRMKSNYVDMHKKKLDKAVDDRTIIYTKLKCVADKCKSERVKQVRIGDDMRLFNVCVECRFQWLN